MSFLGEIKRRKVFQVAAVYAVVAWLTIQIIDVVSEPLNLPPWLDTVVIILFAVGFPIAVIVAWAYEVTPDGIKSDSAAQASQPVIQGTDPKLTYLILALVIVVAGFQIADRFTSNSSVDTNNNIQAQATGRVNRFVHIVPDDQILRRLDVGWNPVSPDGRYLLYNTTQGLYLREMDELEARLIPGTEEMLSGPFFSPDSQSIAYRQDNQIKRIAISGGSTLVIADVATNLDGASWGTDDQILFGQAGEGIYRVPATGGTPELVIENQPGERLASPKMLPDGDTVLFSVRQGATWDEARIVAQSLSSGERTTLIEGGSDARYVPSGHLTYALGNDLLGIEFDSDTLTVSGVPRPLVQGVQRSNNDTSGSANYGITEDGSLIYLKNSEQLQLRTLAWIDREGNEEEINVPLGKYAYAQLSPDGTRIALDSRSEENDIWVYDLQRGNHAEADL